MKPPLKTYTIAQKFGENANSYYASQGLKGHPGLDMESLWDDLITSADNGYIYKILNKNNPILSFYRSVFSIVETPTQTLEVSYGHCHQITANHGPVNVEDPLATEGNTGQVYAAGLLVTEAEKEAGSHAGTHLHFQIRLVKKVLFSDPTKQYLSSEADQKTPFQDPHGNFYEVINFDNGFNGCVDPLPYLLEPAVQTVVQAAATIVPQVVNSNLPIQAKLDFLSKVAQLLTTLLNVFKLE